MTIASCFRVYQIGGIWFIIKGQEILVSAHDEIKEQKKLFRLVPERLYRF
jgi:hypothetical protein